MLMLIASVPAYAGFRSKLPVKWGKINAAEFSIIPAGTDTNAPAVVLCDYGDIEITNRTFYTRHTRIKILNQDGLKYATVEIPYRTKNNHDRFYELKAQTLELRDGQILKHRVEAGQIEDIRINNQWSKKKFTFPGVAPGTIIEYTYEIASLDFEKLDTWYFQREIPTIWSEFRFNVPSPFTYLVSYINNRALGPDEESVYGEQLQWMYSTKARKRHFDLLDKNFLLFNTSENRYKVWALNNMRKKIVMKNLPGLSDSPDSKPISVLYPQVRLDLFESSGSLPRAFRPLLLTTHDNYDDLNEWSMIHGSSEYIGYVHFRLKTWEQFTNNLLAQERFGNYLMLNAGIKKDIIAGNTDELTKINAIIHHVKSVYTWNGEYSQYAGQDFKDFMKTKIGSSAEMNLLLINFFRQAGIESDPVLIRTADLGLPEKMFPVKNQFNHVIATALIGGKTFLFDVTSDTGALNMLNRADIGTSGWVVRKNNPGWIETFEVEDKKATDPDIPVFQL